MVLHGELIKYGGSRMSMILRELFQLVWMSNWGEGMHDS